MTERLDASEVFVSACHALPLDVTVHDNGDRVGRCPECGVACWVLLEGGVFDLDG